MSSRYDWNTYHQADFKEIWRNAHQNMDLPEQIKVQWCHTVVISDSGEEVHKDQLTIPFSSIARFLLRRSLLFRAAFHNDNRGRSSPSDSYQLIRTRPSSKREG